MRITLLALLFLLSILLPWLPRWTSAATLTTQTGYFSNAQNITTAASPVTSTNTFCPSATANAVAIFPYGGVGCTGGGTLGNPTILAVDPMGFAGTGVLTCLETGGPPAAGNVCTVQPAGCIQVLWTTTGAGGACNATATYKQLSFP
jgi:hypothetical protein